MMKIEQVITLIIKMKLIKNILRLRVKANIFVSVVKGKLHKILHLNIN